MLWAGRLAHTLLYTEIDVRSRKSCLYYDTLDSEIGMCLLYSLVYSELTSSDKTPFVIFITIFVATIGFADTNHKSEFSIPNCAAHFASCVVRSPWHILRHFTNNGYTAAAVVASLLSSHDILVRFPKFMPAYTGCLD